MNRLAVEARDACKDAAELWELAKSYLSDKKSHRNPFSGASLLKEAARKGHPPAQLQVALGYSCGDLFPLDEAEALRWFQVAARNGNAEAAEYLDLLVRAHGDEPAAQVELALRFEAGELVVRDFRRAFGWMEKAAKVGEPQAIERVALYCLAGLGTPRSVPAARAWISDGLAQWPDNMGLEELRRALELEAEPMNILADALAELPHRDAQEASLAWREQAAVKGEVSAQRELGRAQLARGESRQAKAWLERAAGQDDFEALELLGRLLWREATLPRDKDTALEYLRTAEDYFPFQLEQAEAQDGEAQEWIGLRYLGSAEAPYDIHEATGWLEKAARQGQVDAQRLLQMIHPALAGEAASQYDLALWLVSNTPVPDRWISTFYWAQAAADQGHAGALRLLASLTLKGLGVEANRERARELALDAAEAGDAEAHFLLATTLSDGVFENSETWLRHAADLGHPGAIDLVATLDGAAAHDADSLLHVGHWYATGHLVEPKREVALELYRQAAELGHEEAARFLAIYDDAQLGDPRACYRLGTCYQNGTLVLKNEERADEMLERGRELAWAEAQAPIHFDLGEVIAGRYAFLDELLSVPVPPVVPDAAEQLEAFLAGEASPLSLVEERLFAADCAQRVLGVFEMAFPDDPRPREAIDTARAFADGTATEADLEEAARGAESAAMMAQASGLLHAARHDHAWGKRCMAEGRPLEARSAYQDAAEALEEVQQLKTLCELDVVRPVPEGTLAALAAEAAARTCAHDSEGFFELPADIHAIEVAMAEATVQADSWGHSAWSPGDMAGTLANRWVEHRFSAYLRHHGRP